MAIQRLADLRDTVRDWANRKDIADQIVDDFINIAQARATRLLRIPAIQTVATVTITDGAFTLPLDYVETTDLSLEVSNGVVTLERKPLSEVEALRTGASNSGVPRHFARKGASVLIAPTSQAPDTASLYYWYAPPVLQEDDDTNWFVTDAPEVLLYGALKELSGFIKDNSSLPIWESQFQAAMVEVQNMADRAEESGSTLSVTLGG